MVTRFIASLQFSSSPYVNALLALAVFVVLAKAADLFVDKVVRRFAAFTRSEADDRVIDLVHRPVFYTILLFGLQAAIFSLELVERTRFVTHGLVFTVLTLAWAKEPALRGRTVHEINCEIYKEFMRLGIRIPFPQRDVHLDRGDPVAPPGE